MEKRTPHYKLSKVQETVADPESQPFTITALRGGAWISPMSDHR
jgi:motility quorum-sensing regulator/GCU-specific mRNA interferase toxin